MYYICITELSTIQYQDLFRNCGGLALVLSHCGTDFKNPLSREWALFCVKNACENNQESFRFINELRPQEIIQDQALRDRGIRVEIDPHTGRFSFKQDTLDTSDVQIVDSDAAETTATITARCYGVGDESGIDHNADAQTSTRNELAHPSEESAALSEFL